MKNEKRYIYPYDTNEEEHLKIYFDKVNLLEELPLGLTRIFFALCSYMVFKDVNGLHQVVSINSVIRKDIAKELGIQTGRLNQAMCELVKSNVISRIKDKDTGKFINNLYIINPYVVGKGKWVKIKECRENFSLLKNNTK